MFGQGVNRTHCCCDEEVARKAYDEIALAKGYKSFLLFFFKVFGGHMSIFGATGTPVLDFW